MRRIYLLLFAAAITATGVKAQIKSIRAGGKNVVRCYTTEIINELRKKYPYAETDAHFEAWLKRKGDERKTQKLTVQNYTIPIIFHIIYDGEAKGEGSNVAQSLIQQQVLQLNKDYANLSNSPYAVATNTGIQFVLAQKDTLGHTLAEPGIERIDRSSKGWKDLGSNGWQNTYVTSTIKPQSIWDPSRYLNIWLVPAMNNGSSSTLLGYATFPVSSTLDGLDANPIENDKTAGVVVDHSTVGSVFQPFSCDQEWGRGKTLTHELGHFFGLRHIWGDGKCADDYVDDTPIHEDANYGKPIHPKPNSCGTPDEMFENYMDYCDDEVLNTFTSDQTDRIQTVMQFSPRRNSLATSNVGFVTVTGSNKIKFANCTGTIITTETGTTGVYPHYKDISLNLNAEYQATGDATVTIKTTGDAVNNVQYKVLTPTLIFAKGDVFKSVVIRLFDNASVDGDRSLTVSYTITGSGVAKGSSAQDVTIDITDDDNIIFAGQSTVNIIDEKFETIPNGSVVPTGWGSYTTSAYPNVFVASTNGNAKGSGKAAHITNNTSTKPNTYTKGKNGAAELLSPEIDPLQYQSIDSIRFKYSVKGSADDHGYLLYDIGDGNLYFWGVQGFDGCGPYYGTTSTRSASLSLPVPGGILSKKFSVAFYWETDTAKTGGDPGFNIDDVVLTAQPYRIENTVSASNGYDVLAGSVNKFRSNNNKLVASITAATADIAGVTAAVAEAGNDKPEITLGGTIVNRTRKIITLKPATTNTGTSYTATFYFTAEEMAAWGADAGNLKILKVEDGVNVSGSIPADKAVVVTPTTIDNRLSTEGFIAYTATFTGFSQFMLVNSAATAPSFTWISFTGAEQNNTITLNWKTANETNSTDFEIQRSTDSVTFEKVGSVTAKNQQSNDYTFDDANLAKETKYFYRLKETDGGGGNSYSAIISVVNPPEAPKWLKLHPNPVKDKLMLDFSSTTAQKATIMVSDMVGRVIYKTQTTIQGHMEIATIGWSRGIYIVKVETDDNEESFKIMKD